MAVALGLQGAAGKNENGDWVIPTAKAASAVLNTFKYAAIMAKTSVLQPQDYARHGINRNAVRTLYNTLNGGVAHNERFDRETIQRAFRSESLLTGDKTVRAVRADILAGVRRVVDLPHDISDMWRIGAFCATIEAALEVKLAGMSVAQLRSLAEDNPSVMQSAVQASQNITGNFAMRGSNSTMPAFFMFYKAAMAGQRWTHLTFSSPQGWYGAAILFSAALIGAAAEDDWWGEDADGKAKATRLTSPNHGIFVGYGVYMPVTQENRWIVALARNTYHTLNGDMGFIEAMFGEHGVATEAFINYSPLRTVGDVEPRSVAAMFMPTPVNDWRTPEVTGKDNFGRDLRDNTYKNKDLPDALAGRMSDSATAKRWAAMLYANTGGAINLKPFTLTNIAKNILGASYSMISDTSTDPYWQSEFGNKYDTFSARQELNDARAGAKNTVDVAEARRRLGMSTNMLDVQEAKRALSVLQGGSPATTKAYAKLKRQLSEAELTGDTERATALREALKEVTQLRNNGDINILRRLND